MKYFKDLKSYGIFQTNNNMQIKCDHFFNPLLPEFFFSLVFRDIA